MGSSQNPKSVEDLADRSVLLALQEITEDVGSGLGQGAEGNRSRTPADMQEAQELVAEFLRVQGQPDVAVSDLPQDEADAAARRLLALLSSDPDTSDAAAAVLADPPSDEQLSVDSAVTAAVVLGALVTWLQTKIDIRIERKDGRSEFEFRLTKNEAPPGLLNQIASIVSRILNSGSGRPPLE